PTSAKYIVNTSRAGRMGDNLKDTSL
ncbi:MAG: hypothetical protein ACI888_001277, partial [Flavobacteriales bacterium]